MEFQSTLKSEQLFGFGRVSIMCMPEGSVGGTTGRTLHRAVAYDLLVWLVTRGRERRFRETLLTLSRVQTGESVLDVGCGTGSLAIAAKQRVGTDGAFGIDASPEMIGRANRKARKAAVDITFQQAAAEALPFPDQQFDLDDIVAMLNAVGSTRWRAEPWGSMICSSC
jgi:2-polyprenyl-3-methyl-5-hydroxy-6-metoxy-1,4-benzoquinol methylase